MLRTACRRVPEIPARVGHPAYAHKFPLPLRERARERGMYLTLREFPPLPQPLSREGRGELNQWLAEMWAYLSFKGEGADAGNSKG